MREVRFTIGSDKKEIHIVAGYSRLLEIRSQVLSPFHVQQVVTSDSGFTTQSIFGTQWSWSEFPVEKKAEYEKELAEYVTLVPTEIKSKTILPSTMWVKKYIPNETALKAIRDARKAAV